MRRVLAVDLGGTKTAIARVDADGAIRDHRTVPAAHDFEACVAQISEACEGVTAAGIVVPGIYDESTGRAWCPNLWGSDERPLREALRQRLNIETFIDSDRSGHVLGEAWLGAARGLRHVVFVAIGTGIGVGILSEGRVLRGAGGIAGAAGWFALNPDWQDEYRQTGCWEAEAAGPGVARFAGLPDGQAVVASARAGNGAALAALHRAADYTAMGIANLISLLNPEAVVLGGGFMVGAGDLMVDRIRSGVIRWAQPIAASRCRIDLTQLGEDAGLLGAARLALDGTR
ncbi:MAG TPA: ROK family protein [Vicinamibacterales bacterium]|nr:ROK family protein [Vicinamibacterales bacterium]